MKSDFIEILSNPLYNTLASYYINAHNQLKNKSVLQIWTSEVAAADVAAANGGFKSALHDTCVSLNLICTDSRPNRYPYAENLGTAIEPRAEHNLPYTKTFLAQSIYQITGRYQQFGIHYSQGALLKTSKILGLQFINIGTQPISDRQCAVLEITLLQKLPQMLLVNRNYELRATDSLNPHDYKINQRLESNHFDSLNYNVYGAQSGDLETVERLLNDDVMSCIMRNQYVDVIWVDGRSLVLHVRSSPGIYPIFMANMLPFGIELANLLIKVRGY